MGKGEQEKPLSSLPVQGGPELLVLLVCMLVSNQRAADSRPVLGAAMRGSATTLIANGNVHRITVRRNFTSPTQQGGKNESLL